MKRGSVQNDPFAESSEASLVSASNVCRPKQLARAFAMRCETPPVVAGLVNSWSSAASAARPCLRCLPRRREIVYTKPSNAALTPASRRRSMVQGLPRAAFSSRQWLQQLDNAIVVRAKRNLVQGSAAPRSKSWQSKFSPEILVSIYAKH